MRKIGTVTRCARRKTTKQEVGETGSGAGAQADLW